MRFRPRGHEEAAAVVRGRGPRGVIARGLGRSPGDAAQNAGGSVLDLSGLARIGGVDAAAGVVRCDAGVSLEAICLGFVAYMIAAAAVTFVLPNPRAARLRPSEG